MAEFFAAYGLFIAKIVTFFIFFLIMFGMIVSAKKGAKGEGQLTVSNLNEKYQQMKEALRASVMDKKALKKLIKQEKKAEKAAEKEKSKDDEEETRNKVYVLDFEGDIKASAVSSLRDEVTAILTAIEEGDEVFIRLNNSGGVVHEHGLAASQLVRFKEKNIPLTIAVDKVAASGGYMMACVADRVLAAPFAIVGSIGVIAQLPNFNRLLNRVGVDFEQHTAGEYKRNVTMFGKNTSKERKQLKEQLSDIHDLFRGFVTKFRPSLDMEKVGTGEYWYGSKALELGLVDELITSDDYLLSLSESCDIFLIKMEQPKSFMEKMGKGGASLYESAIDGLSKQSSDRY